MAVSPERPCGLQTALERFAANADAPAPARLDPVRAFQAERLRARHGDHPVLAFFSRELMQGADIGDLADDPAATAARLERLLGQTGTAAAAIEFAALTESLDRELTDALGDTPLAPYAHARAYRAVGRADARRRQLGLVAYVVDELAGVAHSRWRHMAFRMARRPARSAGFGALYELLASGFEALREDRNVERRIDDWLSAEADRIERLLD